MSAGVREDFVVLTFDVRPLKMTDEIFYEFYQRNKDFRFEINRRGNLIIMLPPFLEANGKNADINVQLGV